MKTIYEILRIHIIIMRFFGINMDKENQKKNILNKIINTASDAMNWFLIPIGILNVLAVSFAMLINEPNASNEATNKVNHYAISGLLFFWYTGAWIHIYIYSISKTAAITNIMRIAKLTFIQDSRKIEMKTKRLSMILIAVFFFFQLEWDIYIVRHIINIIYYLLPYLLFSFFITIVDCINHKLDAMTAELKKIKSPYRLAKRIGKYQEEYEQLKQLAQCTDRLFAPFNLFFLFACGLSAALGMAMDLIRHSLSVNYIAFAVVIYSVYLAVKCNSKVIITNICNYCLIN